MICIFMIFFYLASTNLSYSIPPAPDLFSDYNKQINSEADAHAVEMYDAWASNMENLIKNKHRKGIVVEGKNETDQYSSDGLGNITIKEGASVGTIMNKTDVEDSTIIISNGNEFGRH